MELPPPHACPPGPLLPPPLLRPGQHGAQVLPAPRPGLVLPVAAAHEPLSSPCAHLSPCWALPLPGCPSLHAACSLATAPGAGPGHLSGPGPGGAEKHVSMLPGWRGAGPRPPWVAQARGSVPSPVAELRVQQSWSPVPAAHGCSPKSLAHVQGMGKETPKSPLQSPPEMSPFIHNGFLIAFCQLW